MKTAIATVIALAVPAGAVQACPVCFRLDDPATTSGVQAAVFVLMGVTTGVLGGFAAFIVRFTRRARRRTAEDAHLP